MHREGKILSVEIVQCNTAIPTLGNLLSEEEVSSGVWERGYQPAPQRGGVRDALCSALPRSVAYKNYDIAITRNILRIGD